MAGEIQAELNCHTAGVSDSHGGSCYRPAHVSVQSPITLLSQSGADQPKRTRMHSQPSVLSFDDRLPIKSSGHRSHMRREQLDCHKRYYLDNTSLRTTKPTPLPLSPPSLPLFGFVSPPVESWACVLQLHCE